MSTTTFDIPNQNHIKLHEGVGSQNSIALTLISLI